jgi:hypothetical protein
MFKMKRINKNMFIKIFIYEIMENFCIMKQNKNVEYTNN